MFINIYKNNRFKTVLELLFHKKYLSTIISFDIVVVYNKCKVARLGAVAEINHSM